MTIDVSAIREQFPILNQKVNGHQLIYFDNAATSQKPISVIESLSEFYLKDNANIHRGAHTLAARSTEAYESTREATRQFLGAKHSEEIVFTKGTTEGINLIANSLGELIINKGNQILISAMEHHANIVPWQILCQKKQAELKVVPISDQGELMMDAFENLLNERTKIVSIMHVSNALGTVNPIEQIIDKAHKVGAVVVVDGAQAAPHFEIDVVEWDCDFYLFSAHKVYGPTGLGVLYGKLDWLEKMPPFLVGGEMIAEVSFEKTTFNHLPFKFEAGTPNIADVIAFKAALEFVNTVGKKYISVHEDHLLHSATEKISQIDGIELLGTSKSKIGVISFAINGLHHYDIGMLLDSKGIAVRTGHHCAQPLMRRFGMEGTVRASFAVYNTLEEVEIFVSTLSNIVQRRKK
jgi:cysteine desulfurase/selenocysteine lyase